MVVKYRMTGRQLLPYPLVVASLSVALAIDRRSYVSLAYAASVAAFAFALQRVQGVDLHPDALVVRRLGETITVPWTDVGAIVPGPHRIKVVSARGQWDLPAPYHYRFWPDPAYAEKAATIERYWQAARAT